MKVEIFGVQRDYLHIAGGKGIVETPNLVGVHPERIAKLAGIGPVVRMALTFEEIQSPAEDVENKVAAMKSRVAVWVFQMPSSEI